MRNIVNTKYFIFGLILALVFLFVKCQESKDTISDIQQTAALRNVVFTYDSTQYIIGLPEGALEGGHTLAELMAIDSSKYADPANYSITFLLTLNADNTGSDAEDAKFDGMNVDMILDTIESTPVELTADAFTIEKDIQKPVVADAAINLATHRLAGIYIFRQIVDGNDITTTFSPVLLYKIGIKEGTINLPDIQQDIPTRASPEMKAFLSDLLDSGILAAQGGN